MYQQLNSSQMSSLEQRQTYQDTIAKIKPHRRQVSHDTPSQSKFSIMDGVREKLINHIRAKNNNQRLQNILTNLDKKTSIMKQMGGHRKAHSLLTSKPPFIGGLSEKNQQKEREIWTDKASINSLSRIEKEKKLNLLNQQISNMPLVPDDYDSSFQRSAMKIQDMQSLHEQSLSNNQYYFATYKIPSIFQTNQSYRMVSDVQTSDSNQQRTLKEMFQVKPIKLKDKNEMYQEMKMKSELALQFIQQVQVQDITEFRSKTSLRTKLFKQDQEVDSNSRQNLHNQKLKELLKDNSIAHFDQSYLEGTTYPSSRKHSVHPSSKMLKLQGGVTPNLQNYLTKDSTMANPSTDRLPQQPTKRSLSTLRSANRYDLIGQLNGTSFTGEQSGEVILKQSILRFPQFRQSLMTIEQNQEPYREGDFKSGDGIEEMHSRHFQTINQQTLQQNKSNQSLENLSQDNRSRKQLKKDQSSKKKFTLDQKRFNELKRQQQKIQELMRNNYFYNNFALLPNQNPAFSKLKTRFPLFEMVVQDDDFMERLKNRKNDVFTLQDSLHKSIYNDQETKIRPERTRQRNTNSMLQ